MVLCAEPPKLVPVTVEFATDGGGDFTPTVLNDISPPTSPELFPPYTAPHMPTGLDFSSTIGTSSGELPGKQIAQVTISILICYIYIYTCLMLVRGQQAMK